jgi:TonB family protein
MDSGGCFARQAVGRCGLRDCLERQRAELHRAAFKVCNQPMRVAFLLLIAALTGLQAQTFPSPNTTPPTVVHKSDPEYTQEASGAQLQGTVVLAAIIRVDGIPSEIKVVKGLGKGLDEKAIECLQKWRFKPGTRGGEPIPVKATVEIDFRLPPPRA